MIELLEHWRLRCWVRICVLLVMTGIGAPSVTGQEPGRLIFTDSLSEVDES